MNKDVPDFAWRFSLGCGVRRALRRCAPRFGFVCLLRCLLSLAVALLSGIRCGPLAAQASAPATPLPAGAVKQLGSIRKISGADLTDRKSTRLNSSHLG